MRFLLFTFAFALTACGVRGPPRPPKPPHQQARSAAEFDETTAVDTTTLEFIR
jgi:hypothetical protein